MKKKVFSKLLMVALVATVGVFSSCKDYDDDLADIRSEQGKAVTELRNEYTSKIETVNKSIAELKTQYASLDEAYKKADASLQTLIKDQTDNAIKEAKAYSDANLATAKEAAKAAEEAAKKAAEDYAKLEAAAAQTAAINAAKQEVAAAKEELQKALTSVTETIAAQGESIGNLTTAVSKLEIAVQAAQARADLAYSLADKANTLAEQNKANLEAAAADIAKLKTDLANLQGTAADKATVSKLQADLEALQNRVNANVVDLATFKESVTTITSDLAKLKSDLAKEVSVLNDNIAAVKATADGNVATIDAIKAQLTTIDAAWQLADQEIIKTINALASTVDANKTDAASNLKAAVDAITAELAAKQTLIENNKAAIETLLNTKVSELSKLINDNADAIKANAKAIADNKAAQDAANVIMNNAIAQNAKDIAEKAAAQNEKNSSFEKAIEAIKKALGDDTAETLKAYAKSIAESNALQAKLDAQGYADAQDAAQSLTLIAAIADQAEQDQKAWTAAINTAVDNLVKTYQLNSLAALIKAAAENAQNTAETNAAAKAQEIANKALADAQAYAKDLNDLLAKDLEAAAKNLKDNYTTTVDMTAAIETARAAAINQAYLKVLNALLRDYPEWYDLTEEKKLSEDVLPVTILQLAQKAAAEYIEKYGLTKDNAQALIDATIEAGLQPTKFLGTDAEGNELYSTPGVIMKEIELAAAACDKNMLAKFGELDVRLQPIEEFLGETLGQGDAFIASVNAIIAASTTASEVATLKKQIEGTEDSGLLTLINGLDAQAKQTAVDVKAISDAIANVNNKFASLDPKAADSSVDANALTAFVKNIEDLVARVNKNSKLVDNLDNEVMKAFNKNLGKQIQGMITSINLYANQHQADNDELHKLAYWNGEKYEYPAGFDNFDHELTFCYVVEQGLFSDLKGTVKQAEWNYPEGLIKQLTSIQNPRSIHYADDYNYKYDGVSFTALDKGTGYDFKDGRYRSYEDSILVRVSPTNADLSQAEIALLNSKGENIVDAGLIQVLEVNKYARDGYVTRMKGASVDRNNNIITRAAEGNETGLWVIKFKLKDENVGALYEKYAHSTGGDILYAVAVKNTDFSTTEEPEAGKDRYVVSEYDLSLNQEPAKHVWDFNVNGVSIAKIHNRYIMAEQSGNGTTSWTDDPVIPGNKSKFRYELTWKALCADDIPAAPAAGGNQGEAVKNTWYAYCWDCCYFHDGTHNYECEDQAGNFVGKDEIGYTTIIFDAAKDGYEDNPYACGINTVDRYLHSFNRTTGARDMNDGVDNRHQYESLPITFSEDQAPEGETGEWAKIEIEFPSFNVCDERTPIRGFFVTMDQHFAIESDNSEMNAWPLYITKNIAKYPYGNGKVKTNEQAMLDMFEQAITLQKGNKGTIWVKNARNLNDGDVIGFRVHAVNLDGTLTDPDGRAFYVKVGKHDIHHKLSFDITADNYATGDSIYQNLDENGKNPIVAFNAEMEAANNDTRFFNRDAYSPSFKDQEQYRVIYTWREGNPAIRNTLENSATAFLVQAGTGKTPLEQFDANAWRTHHTVLKNAATNEIVTNVSDADWSVEKFFSFKFSNENVTDTAKMKSSYWFEFDSNDAKENPTIGPNTKTQSVLGFINPQVEDRLIDGETYKITMTIQRKDAQTTWITTNTIDIDITKKMPTAMPTAFYVKSGQDQITTDATMSKLSVKLRPMSNGQVDPWKITWKNFDLYTKEFTTDKDKDGNNFNPNQHIYRWGVDVRPWTLEEIFNGLFVKNEQGESVIDTCYYFNLLESGDFLAAKNAYADGRSWAEADSTNKNGTAIFGYKKYAKKINNGTLTHDKSGYNLPEIHWTHLGQSKQFLAGYIFKRVSANLAADGKSFLVPTAEAEGVKGLSSKIYNRDFKLDPVAIQYKNKDLYATYSCAFEHLLGMGAKTVGTTKTFEYGDSVIIDLFSGDANIAVTNKAKYFGNDNDKAYFDSKFPTAWNANNVKLKDLIAGDYLKIDYSSITAVLPGTPNYYLYDYYDQPVIGKKDGNKYVPLAATDDLSRAEVIYFRSHATDEGNTALNKNYTGIQAQYKVYDIWGHSWTITVNGATINAPKNQTSRQAR